MANSGRRTAINIEQEIVDEGDSYDFYQAVKLLNKLSGKQSSKPKLRIQPELDLNYPQSDINEISRDEGTGGYNITTTFFGLYGVSSPLPGYFTEELLDDEWDELRARKDFLDVIHNHIYPLLYQAWLKYKFSHNAVEFDNKNYNEIIFNLIGLGENYRHDEKSFGFLLKYSGLLSQRIKSMLGLKTLLRGILGDIGLDIEPCVKRQVAITNKQRCRIGQQNATLGESACIGQEVIDRSGKFNIELGPLTAEQFAEVSSNSELIDWMKFVLKLYLVQPLQFSIILILEPGAEQPVRLGDSRSAVLGSNCWLIDAPNQGVERVEFMGGRL